MALDASSKNVVMSIRTTPETRDRLGKLAELLSNDLGTTISMSQAIEIAIKEAWARRIERHPEELRS